MNELLFANTNEREALENILAYNQINKCDKEINKYSEEIEEQKKEMKNILKNENVDEEYVDKIHQYKSVIKNMSGDNTRLIELDEIIKENEIRIQEFQSKITEVENKMTELKENIFNTDKPSEIIDNQNEIENLNVRLNDLNDILNQLISDNTPLLIEKEYLIAKNSDNDLNIPTYNKDEINKEITTLEEEFSLIIESLPLPVRENIEFCQKKIKNREKEIEKYTQRKECVINNFPNSVGMDIESEYEKIAELLIELNLKEGKEEIIEPEIVEETNVEENVEEVPEEISDFTDDMIDEMSDLEFEEESVEVTEEPKVEETSEVIESTEEKEIESETETAIVPEEKQEEKVEEKEEVKVEETKPEVTTEPTEETKEEVASVPYVLSSGESLVSIAEKVYPSKENWLAIYYFNKETINKYLVSNGISDDMETITELASDTNLFAGIKLEIPTDYNYKI